MPICVVLWWAGEISFILHLYRHSWYGLENILLHTAFYLCTAPEKPPGHWETSHANKPCGGPQSVPLNLQHKYFAIQKSYACSKKNFHEKNKSWENSKNSQLNVPINTMPWNLHEDCFKNNMFIWWLYWNVWLYTSNIIVSKALTSKAWDQWFKNSHPIN